MIHCSLLWLITFTSQLLLIYYLLFVLFIFKVSFAFCYHQISVALSLFKNFRLDLGFTSNHSLLLFSIFSVVFKFVFGKNLLQ